MKKLRKKISYTEKTVEAFCYCGCSCRAYENLTDERISSKIYEATTSM